MDPKLYLKTPPPLHPDWLAHEQATSLLLPQPILPSPAVRQKAYSESCMARNTSILSTRDPHLLSNLSVHDTFIPGDSSGSFSIPIRSYRPTSTPSIPVLTPPFTSTPRGRTECGAIVIYYHGGGLYVGDLDSEDLTCRQISHGLQCVVFSISYRLMPQFTADDALADALQAFHQITANKKPSRLVLAGSSSGGQLAAQVAQRCCTSHVGTGTPVLDKSNEALETTVAVAGVPKINGVLLRGPVTCDATDGGANLPPKWKEKHFSMSPSFHTSLLSSAAVNASNRTTAPLPLEEENLGALPRHWIQVCTNDVYYADGVCYAAALKEAGVDVRLDVVEGWPHTFWLKAPLLDRAVKADSDMLEGLKWLMESE